MLRKKSAFIEKKTRRSLIKLKCSNFKFYSDIFIFVFSKLDYDASILG